MYNACTVWVTSWYPPKNTALNSVVESWLTPPPTESS